MPPTVSEQTAELGPSNMEAVLCMSRAIIQSEEVEGINM